MSQGAPEDNRRGGKLGLGGRTLLVATALAWLATMGQVLRSEVLARRESADVRALVESARLTREHASARYVVRIGSAPAGHFASTVSGAPHEEQLAYVLEGELTAPLKVRLKGAVLAGWDRRPERFVLEAIVGEQRHRLEGVMRRDGIEELFHIRYAVAGAPGGEELAWVLPDVPKLAPGPLPIPELSPGDVATPRSGAMPHPTSGAAVTWSLEPAAWESRFVAGKERRLRRHELRYGDWTARAYTEASGFPVIIELPGSVVIELVEEGT